MSDLSRLLQAVLLSFLIGATAHCQEFPNFAQVDYVTVQDFAPFQEIWTKAESETVRLALFGDSQETSPGGAGARYIPRLNYEFYKLYGKVGETFVSPGFGNYGNNGPAEWLLRGGAGSSVGNSDGNLLSAQRLPGTRTRIYTSSAFGNNTMLDTSNEALREGTEVPAEFLWNSKHNITATIFGVTFPGSDEFAWRTKPTDGGLDFFQNNSETGTTSIGLDAEAGQFVSEEIGPLLFNGFSRQQLLVRATGKAGAELVGVRYKNLTTPGGVSVQDFAAGGYRTDSFLNNHGEAGKMLAAFGPWDAILVHTGTNDAFSGIGDSAVEYQQNVLEFMEAVRGPEWLNNPTQKFILITDPQRIDTPFFRQDQFDQYAGALAQIALNDPYVMAINSRRSTEELGWNKENGALFLSDVVHYNAAGAILMAKVDTELMFNGDILLGDVNLDGSINFFDVPPFISVLLTQAYHPKVDMNQDGLSNFFDVGPFIFTLANSR